MSVSEKKKRKSISVTKAEILKYVEENPLRQAEVAETFGLSKQTLTNIAK